jgi:hypothetical protein
MGRRERLRGAADIAVSPGDDWLSGLVERRGRFFAKLGDLETKVLSDALATRVIDRPVYVCGLARSGSTILLELLAAQGDHATHRYRDFPMIFTPFWWSWFLDRASRSDAQPFERAHKDRIVVTRESPEAMEEMLWMHFFPGCHTPTSSNVLDAETSCPEFERFYRDHIRKLLLLRGRSRYLSKGNYNVARIAYLRKLFPDSRFIIPVRAPLGHIASLMKQHRLFSELEGREPRVLNYMRRVGHYEFGLDRRPINFGDTGLTEKIQEMWMNGQEVAGWALYWANVYDHVAGLLESDPALRQAALVVHYDALCADSRAVLRHLYAHAGLSVEEATVAAQAGTLSHPDYYKTPFSAAEIDAIGAATDAAHERIRALATTGLSAHG